MAYGVKYRYDFDGKNGEAYRLDILQLDYSGDITAVIGSGEPILHRWQVDEPKAPIKGSVLDVELVNENDTLPLSSFFSVQDLEYQGIFYHDTNILFAGFMVQDDISEILVDYNHYIKLSFTDNLGLLKDVPLNESPKAFTLFKTLTGVDDIFTTPIHQMSSIILSQDVQAGDRIVITGTTFPGIYNIVSNFISTSGGFMVSHIEVQETLINTTTQTATSIQIYRKIIDGRKSLAEIIKIAIAPTNLELNTNVYSQLMPSGGTVDRWLEDTYIDTATFLSSQDVYQDCWRVLETIFKTFQATLFQGHGVWNIVRWGELLQYYGAILGHSYDTDMVYIEDTIRFNDFEAGIGTDMVAENELSQSILRPFKSVKETFMYKQPTEILKNASFARVGKILAVYPGSGTDVITDYEMKDWDVGHEWTSGGGSYVASSATRMIRVVRNSVGGELERYGVIKGNSGFDNRACAESYPIDITVGDRIKYSFDYRTNISQPGNVNTYFILNIVTTAAFTPRAANNKYLNAFGRWHSLGYGGADGLTLLHATPSGDNTNAWQSVSLEVEASEESPVNGQLFVKLAQAAQNNSSTKETHYKNLRFEIFRSIAGSSIVTGHTHTDTQPPTINNREDEEINIDDSPANAISGTLFLSTFTERLQNRTTLWVKGTNPKEVKLGEHTTFEQLFWRKEPRIKLEGSFFGVYQNFYDLSLLTMLNYNLYPTSFFIWGPLEIDYANDKATGTLYEMYKDTEVESDLLELYEYKYLYDNK